MKKSFLFSGVMVFLLTIAIGCGNNDNEPEKDMEKPKFIELSDEEPQNCEVYHRGETIKFKYVVSDNKALGGFNVEIHHNFDHHTHSTAAETCELDPKKTPVNPWVFNKDEKIPENTTNYTATMDIPIPNDIDTGDYHFMVRVTDASGWQELKAISLKIK